jgi:hypothetical protein
MANTFELIASSTAGSGGTASFDFTSIPSTYTDLVVKLSARSNRADTDDLVVVQPNGSSSSLTYRGLTGNGAAASSGTVNRFYVVGDTFTANTFSNFEMYLPNYNSANYKSWSLDTVTENNATTAYMGMNAGLWSNTAAITSITLSLTYGTAFKEFSTAYLYGVSNA